MASWRGPFAPIEYEGVTYGLRVHEFRRFADLPARTPERLEVALDIHEAETGDLELLRSNGWHLADPAVEAADPWAYRDYVQRSKGELMIAKNMYVASRSGWVSDRSICYLASGRPVVAQDTGISDLYPVGEGLLTFDDAGRGRAALEDVSERLRPPLRRCASTRRGTLRLERRDRGGCSASLGYPSPGDVERGNHGGERAAGASAGVRRLNWGCGEHPEPGWLNSDVKDVPGIDIVADVRTGLPLETGSIDYITSIHALPELPYSGPRARPSPSCAAC